MIVKCLLGLLLISCVAAFAPRELLSTKECTWGPSFWCHNITNAKTCNAVKHCVQTVWEHQKVQQDDDDVCAICKNMVQQARDELASNRTQDEIREVLYGSCKLLQIKTVVKICEEIMDKLSPEIMNLLDSQMNPDVICTVVGLCNSASIDRMLEDVINKKKKEDERTKELQMDCEPCLDFADLISNKIEKATPDDIKSYLLQRCRSFGSLSDSCSNIVGEYSTNIYSKLKNNFTPSSLCYLTGSCINNYNRKVQVKTESDVGVIHVNSDAISVKVKHLSEDQTCQLCKQLVKHLKDILIANTTEIEFKQVLKGLCKQTGRFKEECLSIADEYYDKVYDFLVYDLNGQEVCSFAGICAKQGVYVNGPIAPLLPEAPVPIRDNSSDDERKYSLISVRKSDPYVAVVTPFVQSPVKVEISFGDPIETRFQLPVERLALPQLTDVNVNNKEACEFCQYFLHYVQKVITQPYGEKELKKIVNKVCNALPQSVRLQCTKFIEEFGDAFVAILAQEIDPSQVCPAIRVCPAVQKENEFEPVEILGKPGCPFCLMAIEEVIDKLKDNKTQDGIRNALKNLCTRIPKNLKSECTDLVQQYTEEIIDMIIADFTPQEICMYLKLCHPNVDVELVPPVSEERPEILTNEIPRDKVESMEVHSDMKQKTRSLCIMCEFIMDKIESRLPNNFTEAEVKKVINNVCRHMSKSVRSECNNFVKKYSRYIVQFLLEMVEPKMVCSEMHMCGQAEDDDDALLSYADDVHRSVETCALCEAMVGALAGLLQDGNLDRNIARNVAEICDIVPMSLHLKCRPMVLTYGPAIVKLLVQFEVMPTQICLKLELCDHTEQAKVVIEDSPKESGSEKQIQQRPHLLGGNSCTWGPSYWCQSEDHAKACGTLAHCREMVWKASRPAPTV